MTIQNPTPPEGSKAWWSGSGDDFQAHDEPDADCPGGRDAEAQAAYDIEDCDADPCDYAYVEVDDGTGWKAIAGTITKRG